jgi:hypothetical protein
MTSKLSRAMMDWARGLALKTWAKPSSARFASIVRMRTASSNAAMRASIWLPSLHFRAKARPIRCQNRAGGSAGAAVMRLRAGTRPAMVSEVGKSALLL